MEITFIWSWLSFWIGFASVFVLAIALVIILAARQSAKGKKNSDPLGLDDWAARLK